MFARTKRLLLRPLWPEDAPALAAGLNDWEVAKMLASVPYPYRCADADYFITRAMSHAVPQPLFTIVAVDAPGQPLIGGIGFGPERSTTRRADNELGYWIARPHWGKGYATEAAQAVLDLAFWSYRLPYIEASPMLDNPVSAGLLTRKLGFTEACAGEIWCEARQAQVPVRKFRLCREAWLARQCAASPLSVLAA